MCHRPDGRPEFGERPVHTWSSASVAPACFPHVQHLQPAWELTNEIMYLSYSRILAHSRSQGGLYFFVFSTVLPPGGLPVPRVFTFHWASVRAAVRGRMGQYVPVLGSTQNSTLKVNNEL